MNLRLNFPAPLSATSLDSSEEIKNLQSLLQSFGYDVGKYGIDGKLGKDTRSALEEFESSGRIKNGFLSKPTFVSHFESFDFRLRVTDAPDFGERSDQVVRLQRFLSNIGYDVGPSGADGVFGNDTRSGFDAFMSSGRILKDDFDFASLLELILEKTDGTPNIISRILEIARQEWEEWGRQEITDYKKVDGKYHVDNTGAADQPIFKAKGHLETDEPYYKKVGEYWRQGVSSGLQTDGRTADAKGNRIPWSAAFISYVMKIAGAGKRFRYSDGHSKYIRRAIVAAESSDESYGFYGHRTTDYSPKVGDLVCYVRGDDASTITFESKSDDYTSHCDVVVEKTDRIIKVIGGNVEDSVTLKHLDVDETGRLVDKKKKWFAVLENRMSGPVYVAPAALPGTAAGEGFVLSDTWLRKIVEITGKFESNHAYGGVSGNFDGMGISCGLLQWNIGKESLQPLIRKVGKDILDKYLDEFLSDGLWKTTEVSKNEGLQIVNSWQMGKRLPSDISVQLQNLFASPEMVIVQNEQIRLKAKSVVDKFVRPWAKLNKRNSAIDLKDFIWFFDLVTLNGGLEGRHGTILLQDALTFLNEKNVDQLFEEVSTWVKEYPRSVIDEIEGKTVSTFAGKDAEANLAIWKGKITDKNAGLFALGYLRAKVSRNAFQLLVLNRRGSIAIGEGKVNETLFKFTF